MNREYTVGEFRKVVDTLTELVPGMQIATDIICGFPGETDEDFAETVNLIKEYKFSQVHISQFYPRPGTPAARMKKVASNVVKKRSRELTSVFESFTPYNGMEEKIERIWITDIATDQIHLVGHTKGYVQVLVVGPDSLLGSSAMVKITSVGRWSVFGDVIEILTESSDIAIPSDDKDTINKERSSPCSNQEDACVCSPAKSEPWACESDACGSNCCNIAANDLAQNGPTNTSLLLRRKPSPAMVETEGNSNQKLATGNVHWGLLDTALIGGIFISFLTIVALFLYVGS
ncbi:putative tRNA (N(6)-L-threonylcarbamoyladenosine(37)-C(2))-methylthiotransferase [Helianthus debilis subsp. tardiflorus]